MTTIELSFLANRYHATAWGRHVNEGVTEWPPSPYRLLRALYDAWRRKCLELDEKQVGRVMEALAGTLPTFRLPKAVAAHTRSYLNSNTEDASDKSLIFDGFLAFAPEAKCFVSWDVWLGEEDRRNLSQLLGSLNYLGRSESWIQARLVEGSGEGSECRPAGALGAVRPAMVACPVAPDQFRKREGWLTALAYSSSQMLKDKVSQPPAMRYVPYELPSEAVTTWLPARDHEASPYLSAAILDLQGKVLPLETDAVRVAERVRGRLMRYFESRGGSPAMVHGKDEHGRPLRERHKHLFILPRANERGRIDQVLIYTTCEKGFADGVADAIAQVKVIRWIEPIRAVAAWMGRADDAGVRPLAKIVRSSTPFVTVRHWRHGRGSVDEFLQAEVKRECGNHGLTQPISVRRYEAIDPVRFRRSREGDVSRPGYCFELEFPKPVRTPFALGYGCHFGLGQFDGATR